MAAAGMPPLAHDRVRYVGEPVAIVIAETLRQAMDAAEKIEIDYDVLESTSDVRKAMSQDAEQ